jgi:putative transposase
MILAFRYRVLPSKAQHRALERILDSQRHLYNAALEERIGAYRKAGKLLSYFDQTKGLTEWRRTDSQACELPLSLQRATLKRVDEAYRAFFRRVRAGDKPGFPRFRGKGRFDSFGFREFSGIKLQSGRLQFKDCLVACGSTTIANCPRRQSRAVLSSAMARAGVWPSP